MQKDIKLIGLDLDGTTLNDKKEITPRVRAAIEGAIRAGIVVLPATGRVRTSIPPEFLAIPGVRYALCANGALVYNLSTGETLISDCFSRQTALALYELLAGTNTLLGVFVGGEVCSGPYDFSSLHGQYDEELIRYLQATRKTVSNVRQLILESPLPVEKISMLFPRMEDRAVVLRMLEGRSDCQLTASMPNNLEANAAGVNKGDALLKLGRLLGFERSQVMAVGDGLNDAEMLEKVGWGVAMANSMPETLAVADWVTASNEEDGVAVAIEAVLAGSVASC